MLSNHIPIALVFVALLGFTPASLSTDSLVNYEPSVDTDPPAWLQVAAEIAVTLPGVYSAQGLRVGNTTYYLAIRGDRTCPDSTALWNALDGAAPPGLDFIFPGDADCWPIIVKPSERRVPNTTNLLTWELTLNSFSGRPHAEIAEVARTLRGVVDAEVWRNADIPPPVLAMYRRVMCPGSNVEDAMRQDLKTKAAAKGIDVDATPRECYVNEVGPLYRDGPIPTGATYIHLHQIGAFTT